MKKYLVGFWFSMPVQLFFLHFRKYQVFLIFWYILFATTGGFFMNNFGADSLFLAPEYYNKVDMISTGIVGIAIGIFIMSWNITTFILHRTRIQFLATTAQPFLKYCINNAVLPLLFLIYYFITAVNYNRANEFKSVLNIILLTGGFLMGLTLAIGIAFIYFFGADKTIYKQIGSNIIKANEIYNAVIAGKTNTEKIKTELRVDWFFSARFHLRKPRDIRHYSDTFLDDVFKRHHLTALLAFFIAFAFLIALGFTADAKLFQIPAAASITILFALLVAVGGAFSVFLKSWSIPVVLIIYLILNYLYQHNILDFRNKAYGLNYNNAKNWPLYNSQHLKKIANTDSIHIDSLHFIQRLDNWKKNQPEEQPILYIINTSGGGLRSATFTFSVLQMLDKEMFNGKLMQKTFLMNGASGGLLGAAYYRELYLQHLKNKSFQPLDNKYLNDITTDLLNPLFSSFVTRDIIGPVQKFTYNHLAYTKDRGYAFEQKLNENTRGFLNKNLHQYFKPEQNAFIPTLLFNSVITMDGRKMITATHPVRFLMQGKQKQNNVTTKEPDCIDFNSFFKQQQSDSLSVLTALRMNATFPYVLPNVWLPTQPVTDVMDAGLRDNFGLETTLRFINFFEEWLQKNTSKVVLIQIRDRSMNDWDRPYENKTLLSTITKPAFLLQYNWFKLQDYYQHGQIEYLSNSCKGLLETVCFQYTAKQKNKTASLSFHLTTAEKKEIINSLKSDINTQEKNKLQKIK